MHIFGNGIFNVSNFNRIPESHPSVQKLLPEARDQIEPALLLWNRIQFGQKYVEEYL